MRSVSSRSGAEHGGEGSAHLPPPVSASPEDSPVMVLPGVLSSDGRARAHAGR